MTDFDDLLGAEDFLIGQEYSPRPKPRSQSLCHWCGRRGGAHDEGCRFQLGHVLAKDPTVGSYLRQARENTPHEWGMQAVGFQPQRLEPGACARMCTQPQINFGGPYRLDLNVEGPPRAVVVRDLCVGNCSLLPAPAELILGPWDLEPMKVPTGLPPLHGPVCTVGYILSLDVRNVSAEPITLRAQLWGYTQEALTLRGERPGALAAVQRLLELERGGVRPGDCAVWNGVKWVPGPSDPWAERRREFVRMFQRRAGIPADGLPGPQTLEALESVPKAWHFSECRRLSESAGVSGSADAAAAAPCLPSPPAGSPSLAPVKQITAQEYIWQQRRDEDRAASAAYEKANPRPPRVEPEPEKEWWQEQWSTATDES